MLSSIVKPSSFFLIVLLFFSSAFLTHSGKIVEVEKICQGTFYPKFCSKVLNSIPGGARSKDLVTLAEHTVDVAQANLSSFIALLKSQINNTASPVIKRRYEKFCYSTYTKEAVALLQRVKRYLKDGNYRLVNYEGATLMVYSIKCRDVIPDDQTIVGNRNKDFSKFGNIIAIIGDVLRST